VKTNIQQLHAVRVNPKCVDPAIDPAKSDLAQYKRTRDLAHLVYKEGVKPAVFVLDPLGFAWVVNVCLNESLSEAARCVLAFRGSCFRVSLPDGTTLEPTAAEITDGVDARFCSEDWVKRVSERFGLATVLELGKVALQRAELPAEQVGFFV